MKKILCLVPFVLLNLYAFDLGSATNSLLSSTATTKSTTEQSSLLNLLTSNLGVSNSQAVGGASAILTKAATNMSQADVSSLTSAIPSISSLISSTVSSQSGQNMLGSLVSSTSLGSQFSALGMDSSMVGKFIPIILQFINTEAGSTIMNSVQSALK
ncbi:MAG TPA: hypothetical protein CFH82_07350 [Sulfurospirillum sp. UBA12182]|jgi:hypothetical protein|nr:MAG TPA: hypothetical protein CFH82_07350 [Sulfurospirillum sp. UBA12182]